MINHKLSRKQAKRIGEKAGTVVQCTLFKDSELAPSQRGKGVRMAKDVYLNGRRIGGTLSLD